ncbi:hypothetical protein CMUS01_11365 [Colletotrichum musicola]|uniref:WSC domain-containing protein n=1 Tax=Colletotrichum musicola TaxID=2175873 RepID=A0A8H6JZ23_9PEZI|nr:hypothetical protein CMUS01_11365 [Colletotrichum musicola]
MVRSHVLALSLGLFFHSTASITTLPYRGCGKLTSEFDLAQYIEFPEEESQPLTPQRCIGYCDDLGYQMVYLAGGNMCYCRAEPGNRNLLFKLYHNSWYYDKILSKYFNTQPDHQLKFNPFN